MENVELYNKWSWKRLVKSKLSIQNAEDLFHWGANYKKINLESYNKNELKMKSYLKDLSLKNARVIFRRNCGMIQTVRYNFKNDQRYKSVLIAATLSRLSATPTSRTC